MKTLLIVTDAWSPQTNGVVTTLQAVIAELTALGIDVAVAHPGQFRTLPLPSYPEIRIAANPWRLRRMIREHQPDAIHIATEGPLGLAARNFLTGAGIPFSSAIHTKFPEYLQARTRLPLALGYRVLRWFHEPAASTLCTTESHRRELAMRGFEHLLVWGRGVDTRQFRPSARPPVAFGLPKAVRPRLLYVGRIAVEKNIDAFLSLPLDADRIVVGDGPARVELQKRFPDAQWRGLLKGEALVREHAAADVMVFPSRTDTFGLVMLEAMACGTPVAAFPATGPIDVVSEGINGALDEDLALAVSRALTVPRERCRGFALEHSWRRIAERLLASLTPIRWPADEAVSWVESGSGSR
ncbi:MAG: glycosyltransferase family 1 protein [Pseudomonadales bacterium]